MQKSKKYLSFALFMLFCGAITTAFATDYAVVPNPPFTEKEMRAFFNEERRVLETNSEGLIANHYRNTLSDDFTFILRLKTPRRPVQSSTVPGLTVMQPGRRETVTIDVKGDRHAWIGWNEERARTLIIKKTGILGLQYDAAPMPISYNRVIDAYYKTGAGGDFERDGFNRPLMQGISLLCKADFRRGKRLQMTQLDCSGQMVERVIQISDPVYPGQGIPTEPWHAKPRQ